MSGLMLSDSKNNVCFVICEIQVFSEGALQKMPFTSANMAIIVRLICI